MCERTVKNRFETPRTMMRTTSTLVKSLAVFSALLPFCTSGLAQQAAIVYENATTDLNRPYGPNGVEFGDEITLAGSNRTVTEFQFEYCLSGNANGNETVQLRFYANDGATIN